MFALLSCALALQVPVDQPHRLRTILENHATILVERIPGAKTLSLQVFASSRGCPETPQTNGLRHLIEHLAAKGDGDLDMRLETMGGFLSATTLRDATVFDFELPTNGLSAGLKFAKEIVQQRKFTQDEISHEAAIIAQEGALRDSSSKLSSACWSAAYGDGGLDPFGDLEVISSSRPDDLVKVERIEFGAENLAIVVAGDVDLDSATGQVRTAFEILPSSTNLAGMRRKASAEESIRVEATGEAAAMPVLTYRDPSTAAVLAAALSVAVEMKNGFVIYTPSASDGLVILGTRKKGELRAVLDKSSAIQLFATARVLAKRWVAGQLEGPQNVAYWRGLLLVQARDLRPETLTENIDTMTLSEFAAALQSFVGPKAIYAEGTR